MTAFSLHCEAGSGLGEREKKTLDVRLWYLCLKHPWKEMIFMVGGGGGGGGGADTHIHRVDNRKDFS